MVDAWWFALSRMLPDGGDLLSIACVICISAVFIALGRCVATARASLEVDLLAGWGMACLSFTLAGVVGLPLYLGALPLLLVLAARWRHIAFERREWQALGRVVIAFFPMLVVIAGLDLWQSDAWAFWLPNYRFIEAHDAFPTEAAPPNSFFYAFPYNLQLAGYAASFMGTLPKAMLHFNLILHLVLTLAAARILHAGALTPSPAVPSWRASIGAVLAMTVLNPGFVPSIAWTATGDGTTAVVLALACVLAWQGIREPSRYTSVAFGLVLGLVLAALINIKQANVVLVGGVLVAMAGMAWLLGPEARRFAVRALPPAALIPAVLFVAWRAYVAQYLPESENTLRPFAEWQFGHLGTVLLNMVAVMQRKGGLFLLLTGIMLAAIWLFRQRGESLRAHGLIVVTAFVVLLYNAFLITIYIAWTTARDGEIISYWRYSTQLAPLAVLSVLPWLVAWLHGHPRSWQWMHRRGVRHGLLGLYVVGPLLLIPHIRYDLEERKVFLREVTPQIAARMPPAARIGIITAGYKAMDDYHSLRGILLHTNPGIPIDTFPVPLDFIHNDPRYRWLLLSCRDATAPYAEGPHKITLLQRNEPGWRVDAQWPAPKSVCERES